MFKKAFALGLILVAPSLFAQDLNSFDKIIDAISKGKQVSVVMITKLCKVTDPNDIKLPPNSALTKIESAIFSEDVIAFDATKYARAIPDMAPNGLIHRASFVLNKNGQFNGVIATFDAVTNTKPANRKDITVDCQLGENVHFYLN